MVERMEPSSSLQSTWNFFCKLSKKKLQQGSSLVNKIPIQGLMLFKIENLPHMQLVFHWASSNCCDSLRNSFHIPMIKITSTPHIFANFYTGSCARTFHPSFHIIPQNKTPWYSWLLSPTYHSKKKDMAYLKKKKRYMLKKAWWKKNWTHEGPSIQKKKKELDTWRSKYSKREREIAHVQRKRNKGERWFMKGFHTPSTQIFTHVHILIKVYDLFLLWIRSLT